MDNLNNKQMLKIINFQPKNMAINTPQDWRSWLNDLTEWQHDLLHNHRPDGGEIYRYPLVQFHAQGFRGINEGASLLMKILPLLEAETDLEISTQKHDFRLLEITQKYEIKHWQPFNADNYALWNTTNGLADRVHLLENILVSNILGLCRVADFEIPNKMLTVKIIENIKDLGFRRFSTLNAELYRRTFNLSFETNLDLPLGIGLGRGTSKGFGSVQPIMARQQNKKRVVQQ